MRKTIFYSGLAVALLGGLTVLGSVLKHRHNNRQAAVHRRERDDCSLPSLSQQRMALADTLDLTRRDTLFRHHNLAKLFELSESNGHPVQNGFFGPRQQRMEVVFRQVWQDGRQPGLFHLSGLTRIAGEISAIEGTLLLNQVRNTFEEPNGVYTATGPFWFRQHSAGSSRVAELKGVLAVDFSVLQNEVSLYASEGAIRLRSRQFAFEGTWRDTRTGQQEPVLWAAEFVPLADEVLKDFDLGSRMAEINPKYNKYGWADYYKNEEWWADSAKPALSL